MDGPNTPVMNHPTLSSVRLTSKVEEVAKEVYCNTPENQSAPVPRLFPTPYTMKLKTEHRLTQDILPASPLTGEVPILDGAPAVPSSLKFEAPLPVVTPTSPISRYREDLSSPFPASKSFL